MNHRIGHMIQLDTSVEEPLAGHFVVAGRITMTKTGTTMITTTGVGITEPAVVVLKR